ncbi:MAG TPA: hypothetical protein VGQ37_13395 [Vicinamibacterales bacterium]|nr:hypothetical protein [Vicinamibacterales bacterium]
MTKRMTMTETVCALVLAIVCTTSVLAGQANSVHRERLDPRIGPAVGQRYKSIHDARQWANPMLVIQPDGIEVIAKGVPNGRRVVASRDLRQTLVGLAPSAWPYGRVVAVQEVGIREPDGSDRVRIVDNLNVTLTILKALKVTVERWPSA